MGTTRTAWHVLLAALIAQRGPRGVELRSEVPLSTEPLRADFLLLQLQRPVGEGDGARTLRKLWALLPKQAIVEFKSVGRPYRSRNLHRLWSYLHLHYADQPERLKRQGKLCGVLLVPARTPPLHADAKALGLSWSALGDGYWRLLGGPFSLIVGEIDVIAEAEDDDLLRLFGHADTTSPEGRRWLSEQLGAKETDMVMEELEGYEEVALRALARLPPKRVLAKFKAEELLQALPDETLRALSDEYLATLPEATRAAIRGRIGR